MKKQAYEYYTHTHPYVLISHDIVITTFESLSAELDTSVSKFIGSGSNRKYEIVPSPIIGISWNRIVFDEAQEVEDKLLTTLYICICIYASAYMSIHIHIYIYIYIYVRV